jgi:subtilisin family serine protease
MTRFVFWQEAEKSLFKLPNTFSPGAVSAFSSWGPTFEMNPKPQFGAAGASILSTYLTRFGGYAIMSGTSMATPLVAAAFSLVAEARGTVDLEMIENLLAVTSNPQLWIDESGNNGFENWLTPPAQQGAGLIQVYDAAYVTTLLKPSSLSFNDTDNNKARSFSIGNEGNEVITYNISHVSSNSIYVLMGDSETPALFPDDTSIVQAHAKLSFSETAVTIAPGETAIIEVTATPPQGIDVSRYPLWSGYITVNGTDGSSLSVPYQGLAASLHDAKMLSDDSIWVATSKNPFLDPLPPDVTFDFPPPGQGINYPRSNSTVLVINLNWGSPKIVVDAISLATDPPNSTVQVRGANSVGRLSEFPSLWKPRGLSAWYWRGALDNGEYVPPGNYKLLIKILRIFGDESNEEDWVVAETTSFHIRYIS